ncbi:hypothetical protein [Streptomyces sp. NPDC005907]|uniref:hypothetical protein n=1 Tax=Streptomyces sp. NPDC005907 TaxID=3154571 RepID=UPI0033F662C6
MTALERAREYFDRIDENPSVDNRVAVIASIGAIINHLEEGGTSDVAGMSRVDALKAAREHVEAMSTNGRGYQDGVKLSDKVQAVDRFARFLMGESE